MKSSHTVRYAQKIFYTYRRLFILLKQKKDEDLLSVAVILILSRRQQRQKNQKRIWIMPWLSRRQEFGAFDNLMKELEMEDTPGYVSFQRMHPELFEEL